MHKFFTESIPKGSVSALLMGCATHFNPRRCSGGDLSVFKREDLTDPVGIESPGERSDPGVGCTGQPAPSPIALSRALDRSIDLGSWKQRILSIRQRFKG